MAKQTRLLREETGSLVIEIAYYEPSATGRNAWTSC